MVQRVRTGAWLALLLLGGGAVATHGYGAVARELSTARSLSEVAYVGSDACRSCHPDHTESFRRTFHRTMTQEAGAHSVLGDFDSGQTLDYFGVRARMTRGAAGEFWMSFSADGGAKRWGAEIERTVGSRRYQQYLARDGDVYFRLPVAWDVTEGRFIHMNGAFLTPDPGEPEAGESIGQADYNRHVTRWNDNCVFCHNVQPNPGLDPATGRYDTQVAELGIACEACHGPGAEHVARNRNPVRRYALQLTARADPSIRNPALMTGARSAEVCGRCHGQRITSDIDRFLQQGDRFVPGDRLSEQSRPLFRDTTQNGEAGLFAPRFWNDGTARLTAYEYQGYLQSACGREPKFSCESCHAMHEGDPRGQIHPERVGDAACTQCHTELAAAKAQRAHSHHDPNRSGGRCTSCHMPEIVYGLVTVHLSHRIERPDPARDARAGRPDACTLCHVDRSRAWAIEASARLFGATRTGSAGESGERHPSGAAGRATPATAALATDGVAAASGAEDPDAGSGDGYAWVPRQLFAGDPIERAVAAHALGEAGAEASALHLPRALELLAEVIDTDAYPAVRSIALRSIRSLLARHRPELAPLLRDYAPTLEPSRRRTTLVPFRAALRMAAGGADSPPVYPSPEARLRLRSEAERVAIEIGE